MAELRLNAEIRNERGKGPARRLRAAGKVPGTMYGEGGDAVSLAVDARALSQVLATDAGVNALIDLQIDGSTHLAMARELDRDPVRGAIRHVDFLRIDRTKPITVDIPVHIEGTSPGISEGGVLEHHTWQLHVSCLPGQVPDSITVDISSLGVGDSIRVADIAAPEGVTILTAEDEIIASVVIPQMPTLEEPGAEEALEGEVAAEGAEESEGEDGESPAAEGDES